MVCFRNKLSKELKYIERKKQNKKNFQARDKKSLFTKRDKRNVAGKRCKLRLKEKKSRRNEEERSHFCGFILMAYISPLYKKSKKVFMHIRIYQH